METVAPLAAARVALALAAGIPLAGVVRGQGELEAVGFERVRVDDAFWGPRLEVHRRVTLEANLARCEETGRIDNFAVAGGLIDGSHRGLLFDDSDLFKVLEGVAKSLALYPDVELERRADAIIAKIASAQGEDGYLNTYYTLVEPLARWTNIAHGHELYCAGHLIEAGIAYARATGKTELFDVAVAMADCIDREFGEGRRLDPPGHQELELALFALARETGEERFAALARFFLDRRGDPRRERLFGAYAQDDLPVLEQTEATGHAVRATYQYCAMADVARAGGAPGWRAALEALWDDVVGRKMYVTGGIGSTASNEGFSDPYHLPNETAYCETCASVGMGLWAERMLLLTGEVRYADVLERELYNNITAGVSLSGDRFFYANVLASSGGVERVPWFDCSCCPTNLARYLPGLGGKIYARSDDELSVVLYVGSSTELDVRGTRVLVRQQTSYPRDGRVTLELFPDEPCELAIRLRVPGWCDGAARARVTGVGSTGSVELEATAPGTWLRIRRRWESGDRIELELPMPARRVRSDPRVEADLGRVAVMRGPVVYAFEGIDHGGSAAHLVLPPDAELEAGFDADLLGGVPVVAALGLARADAEGTTTPIRLMGVPYATWANRGPGEMVVWLPESAELAASPGETFSDVHEGTRIRGSHCYADDTLLALNDHVEPDSSSDHSIPRHTFWDHRGTSEWLRYEWDEPREVAGTAVYWFDDTGRGACRTPATWRILWKDGDEWRPVQLLSSRYETDADRYCPVAFDPVRTDGLALEVELRPGWSGGVLEWRVDPPR